MTTPASPPIQLPPSLSREFLIHHRVCPKALLPSGELLVAVAPNAIMSAVGEVAFAYGTAAQKEVLPLREIEGMIERLATNSGRSLELERVESEHDEDLATDVRDLVNQPPVVRYVNLLVRDAYDAGASDIHLEATRSGLSARFRLDGVLS